MKYKIKIFPMGLEIDAKAGIMLHEVCKQAGINLTTYCNGFDICGKCKVQILTPKNSKISENDKKLIHETELKENYRLACGFKVESSMEIFIPENSLLKNIDGLIDTQNIVVNCKSNSNKYGLAIDLGTTTIAVSLMNCSTGEVCAVYSALNKQAVYGADVISRIDYSLKAQGLQQLHEAVIDTIEEAITYICERSSITRNKIEEVVVAGNTTMQHILLKEELSGLASLPFEPTIKTAQYVPAKKLDINLEAMVYIYPVIGGFVGGDTVACAMATKLFESKNTVLLIDIGTNGEVFLLHNEKMYAASAPAGPAFEGRGISCGMHGIAGAIEHLKITETKFLLEVISETEPKGICGSGLIDCTAEFLKFKMLDETGRVVDREELKESPEYLNEAIIEEKNGNDILIYSNKNSQLKLTQKDFREVQLAKAAIAVSWNLLLNRAGINISDLDCVYMAGAFGNHLDPNNSSYLNLIPKIELQKIINIGNAASTGAKILLVNPEQRIIAENLAKQTEHIELAKEPDFMMVYAEQMLF